MAVIQTAFSYMEWNGCNKFQSNVLKNNSLMNIVRVVNEIDNKDLQDNSTRHLYP